MISSRRILDPWLSVSMLWLIGMPMAAHADDGRGVLREAGAWLSMARTTYGGQFVEESPAERIPVLGFAAGAFVRLEFARPGGVGLGLQAELGYAPRGADVELDGMDLGDARASYLELPILARIESPLVGPLVFYAIAGPTLSILLGAESTSFTGNVSDTTDNTSTLDLGLTAGLGASVVLTSRIALSLETRYVHGMLTIDESGEIEFLNRALFFSLAVGARFGVDEAASLGD
jgi:opacity protein-like surface antigen